MCVRVFLGAQEDKPNSVCWTDCAHFVHLCVVIRTQPLPPWRKTLYETLIYTPPKKSINKSPLVLFLDKLDKKKKETKKEKKKAKRK